MKIYTGYPGGITKITNDKGFYQTEDLVNVISVYVNQADVTGITYTLALEFLRADGRKTTIYTEDSFASGEATTLTEKNVTYDIHNFTLTNTQLAVAGALAFTCYINILNSGVVEKRGVLFNAVSNVRKTVTYSANTIFVVSEDDEDVPIIVADMKTAIETLSGQLASKVNKADIADDLTTNNSSKVLSAKQGKVLKAMLDTLEAATYTIAQVDNMVDGLYVSKMYGNIRMSVSDYDGELVLDDNVKNRYVDPTWYHLQVGDKIVFNGNTNYRYWLAIKDKLSDSTIHTFDGDWRQETYVANAEVYVRITLAKTDDSNILIDFLELLGEDVITIHTRKPVTVRIGTVYGTNLNSYLYYSGADTFNHRLRTSVIKFNKGDIINFKEFGTKYEWSFMAWDFDGTFISETLWEDGNVYVVQQDCQAVILFKKSGYDKSLMLKGNIYFKKDLDGTDSTTKSVIVLDNTCVKTGETITISNTSNALLYKIDFLSDEWGQGTTSLQTIDYGTSSATVTANMSNVKNVVITMKKADDTSFSNIASEILWNIYRQDNITSSLGDKYDVNSIYNVDFEVNGTFEINTFNSNVVQCGHRGWDTLAPENTIPSFELAYKLGCRFIEGDVRWTADGVPVMLHDVTLNRTARNEDGTELSSTINIANITYAQALEYDFGIYQGALYKGTKLPTFDEVMKWCKTRDVYFQIDLTTGSWSNSQVLALYKIVAKYGMFDNLIWESGSSATISYLISLGVKPKNTMVSYYSSITTANVDTAYNLGCKVFSIQYSLATYSLIQYALSKGIKPFIWFDDLDKNAYNVFRLFNLGTIGFYNTKITDIYALRWFKTLIGYDDNSQSAVTNKEEELLQQAYSDISDLLIDVSTLEQDNAELKMEVTNLKSVQNVVEVVATKSALNSYDTTKLDANDKVQVIADESHDGASTIYNWSGSAWQYVGAFGGNSYTKAETYNKTQIDSALSDKADKSDTYTRAVIDSMVLTLSADKADKSTTYTKTEIDGKFEEVGQMFEIVGNEVLKKADKTELNNAINDLRWELGSHTLDVESDTDTKYLKSVPSGAIGCQINKVGGMSYKSENLANPNNTTILDNTSDNYAVVIKITGLNLIYGKSYKISFDVNGSTYIGSDRFRYYINTNDYYSYSGIDNAYSNGRKTINISLIQNATTLEIRFSNNGVSGVMSGVITNVMVYESSTVLPYQPYFSGIRDSAVTSVVSKGANLLQLNDVAETTTNGVTYSVSNGVITLNGTATSTTYVNVNLISELLSNTYRIGVFIENAQSCNIYFMSTHSDYSTQLVITSNTTEQDKAKTGSIYRVMITISSGVTIRNMVVKPFVVLGTTAPTTYSEYRGTIDTLTIPTAIQNLTGYGWGINDTCYNYIDFDRKVFVQKVGRVDLGSLSWTLQNSGNSAYFDAYLRGALQSITLLCEKYNSEYVFTSNTNDKSVCTVPNSIRIRDLSYTDATTFKSAMNGVYLYYELVTPVETDISAYLTTDTIDVESLGTLEFTNTYSQDVPSDIDYLIEEVKA